MNRKSHQTDITLKLYRDGYRITCQCGEFSESLDDGELAWALKRIFHHVTECKRINSGR